MSDIFTGNWVQNLANIRAAGIVSHKVKVNGDQAYYHLGLCRDPKINIKPLQKPGAYLKPRGFGFEADLVVPSIQASIVEMKLLDDLVIHQPIALKLGTTDSITLAAANLLGIQWKLICDGDANDFRRIEYQYRGFLKTGELDSFTTSSPPSDGTPNAADKLYTLLQTAIKSNEVPNGLTKIEFKASADSSYADAGDFTNARYTFETIGETGGGGRGLPRTVAIKFTFDAGLLQTAATELDLLDSIINNDIDLRLTHLDGVVLTIPGTNIGVVPEIDFSGNVNTIRKINLHAEGVLVFNGTSFTTTGGTTWDALWS